MRSPSSDVITDVLAAAVRAPSPYNTQPWRFTARGSQVDVHLDRSRVLATADPDAREARLACGAALFNLCAAARGAGRAVSAEVLPVRGDPDLLGTARLSGSRPPNGLDARLAKAIGERHTNRQPFLERAVSPPDRHALMAAAREQGARLEIIDPSERYSVVAELVRRADAVQAEDAAYQQEAQQWIGGPAHRPDGVPIHAVGPAPELERVLKLRTFSRPSPIPSRPFEQQPLLAAVLTHGAGVGSDVQAGMAMQRVLLTATDLGLVSSFVSQPFEVPGIREELDEVFRSFGVVHTLLRIGHGYPVAPTPRRPVDDVTTRR